MWIFPDIVFLVTVAVYRRVHTTITTMADSIVYVLTDCCGTMVDCENTHVHFASCMCSGYSCVEGPWEGLLVCADCSACHITGGCVQSYAFECCTHESEEDNESEATDS